MRGFAGPADQSQNPRDDDRQIDLLVDGELNESDRGELLARLDETQDGWRRCAMAFLEAQAWRQAIRLEQPPVAEAPASAAVLKVVRSASNEKSRWERVRATRSVLVLAATFLVAFTLGYLSRLQSQPSTGAATAEQPATPRVSPKSAEADAIGDPGAPVEPTDSTSRLLASNAPRPIGLLTWSFEHDGRERQVVVPVVEPSAIDDDWLSQRPSVVPDSMRRAVESRGHRIVEHRKLMNVSLGDGRHVAVPVNEVEVQVASRVYQ